MTRPTQLSRKGRQLEQNNNKKQTKRKARKPRSRAKQRNWREALNALKHDATYEDLKGVERTAKPASEVDKRRNVPIRELIVAEKVFQWRGEHSDLHAEERHMRELIRALVHSRPSDPVFEDGRGGYRLGFRGEGGPR
jgi:hypothetical protein